MVAAEEKSGGRDRSAGFGYGVGVCGQHFQGLLDLVFADRDDGVDKTLHVLEVDRADTLRAQSVGDGARHLFGGELNDLAGAQAGLGIGCEFGFDADHLGFRPGEFDRGSDAADQSSAANWSKDGFDFRQVFEDLEADGALTGDDLFVVVGRHDYVAVLGGEFFGFELAFGAAGTYEYDLGTQCRRCLALDRGGIVGHDDDGLHV